jgi:hypothetical protein
MSFYDSLRNTAAAQPVMLLCGESETALVLAEYSGRTVQQLFELFGDRVQTDVSAIESYTINGSTVSSDTVAQPGMQIRGVKKSDGKGA